MGVKKQPRIQAIDMNTGEVFPDYDVFMTQRRAKIKWGWFMAFQDGFTELANKRLRGESMRVLLYLLGRLDYENFIRQTQTEICNDLGMGKNNVSRAMKQLREELIVECDATKQLRLSTMFGWRGRVSNLNRVYKEQHRQQRKEEMEAMDRQPLPYPLMVDRKDVLESDLHQQGALHAGRIGNAEIEEGQATSQNH